MEESLHVGGGWKSNYSHAENIVTAIYELAAGSYIDGALGSRGRISFPVGTAAHCRSLPGQRQAGEKVLGVL